MMACMQSLTPREIVRLLDQYIVGQEDAKRVIAIAIRNRWRRLQLPPDVRRDVTPRNILMIGPTGVGKTEIARRMAQLVGAPFVKVEATKFTEVGYVGRDVDSIIRDLADRAVQMERARAAERVREQAQRNAEERVIDQLLPAGSELDSGDPEQIERRARTRDKLRQQLRAGELADRFVELTLEHKAVPVHVMSHIGADQMGPEIEALFERIIPTNKRRKRLPVSAAFEIFVQQEIDNLVDRESLETSAIRNCEESGIVFIDELDKLCGGASEGGAPEVSRSGVQRDLLPLVEGSTVNTRYGPVRTDHILFIAAGAFMNCSPSDLMPELQGRFANRVELRDLTAEDYHRILAEPQASLIKQQIALLGAEGVELTFTPDAILEMAETAYRVNQTLENIGARRLYTIVERVMEEVAFNASDAVNKQVVIDVDYVRMRLADIISDKERSEYEL
jgi:ATP-dependent HslUV protease ATP-binding subunit HslU